MCFFSLQFACVASVPVRAERSIGPREGESPSRGLIFRSSRTGTLATQAILRCVIVDERIMALKIGVAVKVFPCVTFLAVLRRSEPPMPPLGIKRPNSAGSHH